MASCTGYGYPCGRAIFAHFNLQLVRVVNRLLIAKNLPIVLALTPKRMAVIDSILPRVAWGLPDRDTPRTGRDAPW